MLAGILAHADEMTYYMNPTGNSYERLGKHKAPKYISWGRENRLAFVRVPAATSADSERLEIRSADCQCNIYLVLTLLIKAAIDGIKNNLLPAEEMQGKGSEGQKLQLIPDTLESAERIAEKSDFIKKAFDCN
jgi:glutamine synthetase